MEEVRVIILRRTYGETQAALVLMPLDSAARATKNGRSGSALSIAASEYARDGCGATVA